MNRQVSVNTSDRSVWFYDKTGQKQELGTIFTDDFAGEGVRKYWFQPAAGNPFVPKRKESKPYKLGIATDKSSFIDPSEVQEMLLNAGLEIVDQYAGFGGARLVTEFRNARDGRPDPISHDVEFWTKRGRSVDEVFPMIRLETNLALGHMNARFEAGIFRLMCTNGAVGVILGLPTIAVKHVNWWKPEEITKQIAARGFTKFQNGLPIGPVVTNGKSLKVVSRTLQMYLDKLEAGELGHSFEIFSRDFRIFRPSNLKPRLLKDYISQLNLMACAFDDDHEFRALELINAYTNAVNARRWESANVDRGAWHHLAQTDPIVNSTMSLAALAELLQPISNPETSFSGIDTEIKTGVEIDIEADEVGDGGGVNDISLGSDETALEQFNQNLANR